MRLIIMTMTSLLLCYTNAFGELPQNILLGNCEAAFSARPNIDDKVTVKPAKRPWSRTYFSYYSLLGNGTLEDIINNLKAIKAQGIEVVWISPVHEQSVHIMNEGNSLETRNDHKYWPKSFFSVDPAIGGPAVFQKLIHAAAQLEMHIAVDMVLDHFGYTDSVEMFDAKGNIYTVDPKTSPLFRKNYNPDLLDDYYLSLHNEHERHKIKHWLDLISTMIWDRDLPIFDHSREEVFQFLYQSYLPFIDAGIRYFRLDAFKHIPVDFMVRILNAWSDYTAQTYGDNLFFLGELLTFQTADGKANYTPLDFVAEYFKQHVRADVHFIDFPKADEVRKLALKLGYGFNHFADFIKYREADYRRHLLKHYVGEYENHDFHFPPIDEKDPHPFNRIIGFAVNDFFSESSTIIFHGGERYERVPVSRQHIESVEAEGRVGQFSLKLNNAIDPMRDDDTFYTTKFHVADHDHLVAEKMSRGLNSILVISRHPEERTFDIAIEGQKDLELKLSAFETAEGPNVESSKYFSYQIVELDNGNNVLRLTIKGPTVALLTGINLQSTANP